jgi:alkanesulfonate monooxygenase SsuD/methylene tetrahydromethanopterin reductase-like flavin-dependent oxidoreductase (luciferase family)
MDEAARIVDAFLRGETVTHAGPDFPVDGVGIGPRPLQRPRPPIWMGAFRPGGIRRAARWDGWIAVTVGGDGASIGMPPEALAEKVALAHETRRAAGLEAAPFDVAVYGRTGLGGFGPADFEAAGATWWLENVSPMEGSVDDLLSIAAAGPSR